MLKKLCKLNSFLFVYSTMPQALSKNSKCLLIRLFHVKTTICVCNHENIIFFCEKYLEFFPGSIEYYT